MIRNTLISLIIIILIFPTIPHAQVQVAPLFVTIVKEIAKASLAAVGSEVGKSAIDYFKTHFNKNKEIADKFGKPQLKKGKIANNKRVWSLSPTGSLKKEDIDELAKILKSIDNNTDQEISAKIGNNNQIIISTQSGKVVIGNDTTNVTISGHGNATNIGSIGQSGGITNFVITPPSTIENVSCGKISSTQNCPLEIDAYSYELPHPDGSNVDGIIWSENSYSDVRVMLTNKGLARIQNINFILRPEIHIRRAVQATNIPGVIISPDRGSIREMAAVGVDASGTRQAIVVPTVGEYITPQVRLQGSELLGNGEMKIILACIALNPMVNGEFLKTPIAPRRPPQWIHIDGTYETTEAGSHKRFHFTQEFQLTK